MHGARHIFILFSKPLTLLLGAFLSQSVRHSHSLSIFVEPCILALSIALCARGKWHSKKNVAQQKQMSFTGIRTPSFCQQGRRRAKRHRKKMPFAAIRTPNFCQQGRRRILLHHCVYANRDKTNTVFCVLCFSPKMKGSFIKYRSRGRLGDRVPSPVKSWSH